MFLFVNKGGIQRCGPAKKIIEVCFEVYSLTFTGATAQSSGRIVSGKKQVMFHVALSKGP